MTNKLQTAAVAKRVTLTKLEAAIALGLYRSQPIKGCHSGRGCLHSESCWLHCHDSWLRDVSCLASNLLSYVILGCNYFRIVQLLPRARNGADGYLY